MKIRNIVKIFFISLLLLFTMQIKAFAGSFSIRASTTEVEPDATVTIYITTSDTYGQINLSGINIALSSNSVWVDENTQQVTGKIVGQDGETATVTATPAPDNLVDSNDPRQVITGSKSVSINIKKKEAAKPEEQPKDGPKEEPTQDKPTTQTNKPTTSGNKNNNKNTNTNTNKNNNTTTDPTVDIEENKEDQGTVAEFGITSLYVYGIKESGQSEMLELFPEFDINTYEYTCNVSYDIVSIELEEEANEYKDFVKIEGLDDSLKVGENIIKITLDDEQGNFKQYIIKVIKEETKEVVNSDVVKDEKGIIKFTIPQFILLQLSIIVLEILIGILAYRVITSYRQRKHG